MKMVSQPQLTETMHSVQFSICCTSHAILNLLGFAFSQMAKQWAITSFIFGFLVEFLSTINFKH